MFCCCRHHSRAVPYWLLCLSSEQIRRYSITTCILDDKWQVLAEKMPELLDFSKDLASLEAATKVSFSSFKATITYLICMCTL